MRTIVLGERPSAPQEAFLRARARHIGYGGARGGGKSWAMRTKLLLLGGAYEGIQMLLLRRTLPELNENHVLPLLRQLNGVAKFNNQRKEFRRLSVIGPQPIVLFRSILRRGKGCVSVPGAGIRRDRDGRGDAFLG